LVHFFVPYAGWQNKLTETSFKIPGRYLPEFNLEITRIPETVYDVVKDIIVPDYSQTVTEFNAFLGLRVSQVPDEIQM